MTGPPNDRSSRPALYVGTYTKADGAGLHPLYRASGEDWSIGAAYPDAANASFGAYSRRHDAYYFVDEQAEGALGVYRVASAGWDRLARVATGGAEPCYVSLDATESWVAVANYGSGSVALFQLDDVGHPVDPPVVLANSGHGPVEDRQGGPHAHCACFSPDQRWLYHVDLGTDEILAHGFDPATSTTGTHRTAYRAPPGSGPRHLVFHPSEPRALLLSELASTLTVLQPDEGDLASLAVTSTLPEGFGGESLGGHVSLNRAGDRAYVSNRGHDSIAVFAWDQEGTLSLLQHVPSGGASPRAFVLIEDERQLVVVHEQSANITVFDMLDDGMLVPTAVDLHVPGAVFPIVAA